MTLRRASLVFLAFDERWGVTRLSLALNDQMFVSLEGQTRWFADHGGTGVALTNVRPYIDADFLRTVRPESVTLATRESDVSTP